MSNPSETGPRTRARGRMVTALATFAAVAMFALPALAGTVQIKDTADALTSEQEATLQKSGAQYPFDVRVLTTDTATNKSAFDRYVGEQVSSANMVVVAVDPSHHRTSVHFGTGTRIGAGEYKAIEDSGDSHFRDKDFAGGIAAILDRATQAVGSGPVLESGTHAAGLPQASRTQSSGSGIGTWIVVLGVGFIVVMVLMALARRRNGGQAQGYNQQGPYAGGPPPGNGGAVYGQPYYGPQGGNYGGGGSGIGGNIMSAGLGGLVGYEIGKATSEHHTSNDGGGGGGSYVGGDSGGGGSNDTSSYDAGGSSSDWGGGGDSGGGGFDGGGGGDSGGGGGGDW